MIAPPTPLPGAVRPRPRTARRQPPADRRRGVATVELAVLLPLLSFLALITVDFGRVLHCSQVVTDSARAGALYASDPTEAAKSPYTVYKADGKTIDTAASVRAAALAEAADLSPQPTISDPVYGTVTGQQYVEVTPHILAPRERHHEGTGAELS